WHYTYDDYLRVEADSDVRHEFLNGEIFAMAGGTPEHAALGASLAFTVRSKLPANCKQFTSDLRIFIESSGLTTYPDSSVVCGPVARSSVDPLAITNPSILFEVTSPSTEEYDFGAKLNHYQTLPSLKAVVIVSHKAPLITVFARAGDAWERREARPGEQATVSTGELSLGLSVDEIYAALQGL
ncbi:MAG: Uma2 family endonuclease, partial [Deltaproteobacteria bacterium]|nr:Uma2 family endonuclease [Deltaproteobacteria bacterium]